MKSHHGYIKLIIFSVLCCSIPSNCFELKNLFPHLKQGSEEVKTIPTELLQDNQERNRIELDSQYETKPKKHHVYDTLLAGNLSNSLTKLFLTKDKIKAIWSSLQKQVYFLDFAPIAFFGWILKPLSKFFYDKFRKHNVQKEYGKSPMGFVVNLLSQISKISLLVYAADVVDIILTELGFQFAKKYEFSRITAKTLYTIWISAKVREYKYKFLQREKQRNKRFPLVLINRLCNIFVNFISALILVETFKIQVGVILSSLFAFGGVGTLVFSLASKDIVTEVLDGLAISASNKFVLGEKVQFGDHTIGYVTHMGWFDMEISGEDSLIVNIPYSQVRKQRVLNLSRIDHSAVVQILRFQYKDADRLPSLILEVKQELLKTCPKLVTDGTRPFRMNVFNFAPDAIEVKLNTHHKVRPSCREYYYMRQTVLETVADVLIRNDIELALPTIYNYHQIDDETGGLVYENQNMTWDQLNTMGIVHN